MNFNSLVKVTLPSISVSRAVSKPVGIEMSLKSSYSVIVYLQSFLLSSTSDKATHLYA